jgi:signal transduction histidine kinase
MNISLSHRIYLLVATALLGMVLVAGASLFSSYRLSKSVEQIDLTSLQRLSSISTQFEQQFALVSQAPSQLILEKLKADQERFESVTSAIDQNLALLETFLVEAEEKEALARIRARLPAFRESSSRVYDRAALFLQKDAVEIYQNQVVPVRNELTPALATLKSQVIERTMEDPRRLAALAKELNSFLLVFVVLVLVSVTATVFYFVRTNLVRPLKNILEACETLLSQATHQLNIPMELIRRGNLQNLAQTFREVCNGMIERDKQLLELNRSLEKKVEERTAQWIDAQNKLMSAAKMSTLGEMAGGVAHEINNPLAIIQATASQLEEILAEEPVNKVLSGRMLVTITKTAERIAKIVRGLRTFSRDGSADPFQATNVKLLLEETMSLCLERIRHGMIELQVEPFDAELAFEGRATQISQVLLNLFNNAHDAIAQAEEKWIRVSVSQTEEFVEIRVADSGGGIPKKIQDKIFQPFFTTKEIGKGTGMGLSISHGIIQAHRGELKIDNACPNTCFLIRLPKKQSCPGSVPSVA